MTPSELAQLKLGLQMLDPSALRVLKDTASSALSTLTATRANYEAMKTSIELALVPLTAKKDILSKIVDGARESVRIIPPDIIAAFPILGDITTSVEETISEPIEQAENILFEINRQYTAVIQLTADISGISTLESYYNDLISVIEQVLAGL